MKLLFLLWLWSCQFDLNEITVGPQIRNWTSVQQETRKEKMRRGQSLLKVISGETVQHWRWRATTWCKSRPRNRHDTGVIPEDLFAGNRAEKKWRSSGGDGVGYSSDESEDDRRRRHSDDESDSDHRRKSKILTRDYLDIIEKSPLLSSPTELAAMISESPGTARPEVFPSYRYAGASC